MTLVRFIKIILGKFKYLIILPLLVGLVTFLLIRNQPANYAAETSIFTGLTTNSGLEVNGMRVDKNVTQNEYNNLLNILKSKTSYEEIGLRLLAQHLLLSKPQKEIISADAFDNLQKSIPKDVKKLIFKGNY